MKKIIQTILKSPLVTYNPVYYLAYWINILKLIPKMKVKPIRVIVENTNICNLDCSFCPNSSMKRPKGVMSFDLFKKIVDDCSKSNIEHLYHFGIGEPLIDKDYIPKCQYASGLIKDVHCVTNGVLLEEVPPVNYLGISVDATLGTKYEEQVFNNIQLAWEEKLDTTFIELRFKDYQDFTKYKPFCDKVGVYINVTNWGDKVQANCSGGMQFPCSDLWSSLFINWDGSVSLCCKDYECSEPLGNVNDDTIMEIWNSPRLEAIRNVHLQERYDKIRVCSNCVSNTHLVNPWWRVEL